MKSHLLLQYLENRGQYLVEKDYAYDFMVSASAWAQNAKFGERYFGGIFPEGSTTLAGPAVRVALDWDEDPQSAICTTGNVATVTTISDCMELCNSIGTRCTEFSFTSSDNKICRWATDISGCSRSYAETAKIPDSLKGTQDWLCFHAQQQMVNASTCLTMLIPLRGILSP